jgi:hypothetical protein
MITHFYYLNPVYISGCGEQWAVRAFEMPNAGRATGIRRRSQIRAV